MPKPCVSCCALRSSSERLKSRLRPRARQSPKSSTSWQRSSRVWSRRDAPRSGMLCEREWASLRRRKRQDREHHDRGQAHGGQLIDVPNEEGLRTPPSQVSTLGHLCLNAVNPINPLHSLSGRQIGEVDVSIKRANWPGGTFTSIPTSSSSIVTQEAGQS